MNRLIKFRVWCPTIKKFSTHPYLTCDGLQLIWHHTESSWSFTDIRFDDYVIQQFTGLTDKHGKEIYEGDIVKWLSDLPTGGFNNHLFEVIWYQNINNSGFKFEIIGGKRPFIQCCGKINETPQDIEIVGNIFENPELLK